MFSEFSIGRICTRFSGQGHFQLDSANLQTQTHFVPNIRHQNLVVSSQHLYYGKINLIVLIPGLCSILWQLLVEMADSLLDSALLQSSKLFGWLPGVAAS